MEDLDPEETRAIIDPALKLMRTGSLTQLLCFTVQREAKTKNDLSPSNVLRKTLKRTNERTNKLAR
jgi:hypothetical protein